MCSTLRDLEPCAQRILNRANGTKWNKAPHISLERKTGSSYPDIMLV